MSIDRMFGQTINLLAKNLELRARRHEHIAGNIANMETPGYTPRNLSFEKELQETVGRKQRGADGSVTTHSRHIPLKGAAGNVAEVRGTVEERPSKSVSGDGNGVDVEVEMGKLAENQILFNSSIQLLTRKFEGLKYAIKGGN